MVETIGIALISIATGSSPAFMGTLASGLVGINFGLGITLPGIIGTAAIVGVSIGIQAALQPKPPKPDDGMQTKKLGISPRVGGYGRCRISGTYVLYEVAPDDRSLDIVALLSGKVTNFKAWMLGDDRVTLTPGAPGFASIVNVGADGRYGQNKLSLDWRDGSAAQTVFQLTNSKIPVIWTTNHKGNGIASVELSCQSVGADNFQKVYPTGLPEPSVVADLYPLWDFRDAAQDPTNPATWIAYAAWAAGTTYAANARVLYQGVVYKSSAGGNLGNIPDETPDKWVSIWQNPVLQLVDYLISTEHGMALDRTRIMPGPVSDPTSTLGKLAVEADLCDAQVAKKSATEPRYRSCGTYDFSTAPEGVIGNILATCDGWMAENGDGTLALQVGVYRAPSVRIDIKHVVGFAIQYGVTDEELVNVMPITFSAADLNYRETPAQPWRDDASVSLAGVERPRELSLPWVQSFPQARRLAKKAMLRQQVPVKGNVVTDLYGLAALGERYVTLNYPVISGLVEAVVEVQNIKVDFQRGTVSLDWIKIDPTTIDAWSPATEEGTPPPLPPNVDPVVIPVPQNLALVQTGPTAFYLSFDDLGRPDFYYQLRGRKIDDGSGTYGAWENVEIHSATTSGGRTSFVIAPFDLSVDDYELQVASVTSKGTVGNYSSSTYGGIQAETVALRDRMTPPPSLTRLGQIDTLIAAVKAAGAWSLMDGFYVTAAHASQAARLNWKQNAYNLTVGGSPTFTVDRGYDDMTASAYLDTGFLCDTSPRVLSLNDAHLGVWLGENTAVDSYDAGTVAGSNQLWMQARTVAGNFTAAVFAATGVSVANTDSSGHFVATRASSTTVTLYRNGASLGAVASTSTGLTGARTLFLGGMNNGAPAATAARMLRAGHFGRSLSAAQVSAVRTALSTYLTAIGATP